MAIYLILIGVAGLTLDIRSVDALSKKIIGGHLVGIESPPHMEK